MKLTYISLFFFSIVLLRAANPSADNRPQEKLSYQSIFNQIIATPEKAINLADSAENLRIIPEYKAHIIRSRAYARLKNEKKALEYALAAFHTDSVQNDSTAYMNVCQILSNCYIELSRQNEAIEYATKAIQIARSQGNKSVEATSMISISRAQNELAQKDKAIETLDQAIELLQGTTDPEDKRTLISLYMEKLRNIMIQEKNEEAINTGKEHASSVSSLLSPVSNLSGSRISYILAILFLDMNGPRGFHKTSGCLHSLPTILPVQSFAVYLLLRANKAKSNGQFPEVYIF